MFVYTGEVSECSPNTHSFQIELADGNIVPAKALSQYTGPDGASSQISMYRPGSQVALLKGEFDEYIILGCVPGSYTRQVPGDLLALGSSEVEVDNTELSRHLADLNYVRRGSDSHRALTPAEALPGDYIYRAEGGNSLKILKGGINVLDSETAKVTTNKLTGEVALDCSSFRLSTAMGSLTITPDDNGEFALEFSGSTRLEHSSPITQSEGARDKPIKLRLGNNLEVVSANGHGITIDPDGDILLRGTSVSLQTPDGAIRNLGPQSSSENQRIEAPGEVAIEASSISTTAYNSSSTNILGEREVNVSGTDSTSVGGYKNTTVTGPTVFQNPVVAASPANVASREDITSAGSHVVRVGTHLSAGGKFLVNTVGGDIRLETTPALGINPSLNGATVISNPVFPTLTGGAYSTVVNSPKVLVGNFPAVPPSLIPGTPDPWSFTPHVPAVQNPVLSGACKYGTMAAFLQALLLALDSHTHAAPGDPPKPTAPGGYFVGTMSGLIPSIESQTTILGGL